MRSAPTVGLFLLLMGAFAPGACSQEPAAQERVRVDGRVVDPLGDPVPLAVVVARTRGGDVEVLRVQADGSGTFVMPRVPRKELIVHAMAPRRIGERYRLFLDESPYHRVAAVPTVLRMVDAVIVRGFVKDENGKPVPGALVTSESDDESRSCRTPYECMATRDNGSFELPVAFGHTTVYAFAPGHRIAFEQLTLREDKCLDFALRRAPSCELRIHYRDATPEDLDWMAFCASEPDRPDLWQLWPQTRKDATVTFHGVPIGCGLKTFRLYCVPANIEKTSYVVPEVAGPCDIEAPTRPWVSPSQPKVQLRGCLVDPAGQPLGGIKLTKWVSPALTDVAVTGADGRFLLTVQSELASVWIGLEDQSYVPVSPRSERHAGDYAFNMFDVPTASPTEVTLVADKAAAITGRLLDHAKLPIWGATVAIHAGDHGHPSNRSVTTLTDRDGRFALRGLRGSSRFSAWLRATSPEAEFATEELPLRIGETLALGDIVIPKPNVIEGALLDDVGAPRAGVEVNLVREATGRAYDTFRHGLSDRSGRFRFCGVPEGRYTVHVGPFPGRGANWPVLGEVTVSVGERAVIGAR